MVSESTAHGESYSTGFEYSAFQVMVKQFQLFFFYLAYNLIFCQNETAGLATIDRTSRCTFASGSGMASVKSMPISQLPTVADVISHINYLRNNARRMSGARYVLARPQSKDLTKIN